MRLIDADALLNLGFPAIYHTEYGDEVVDIAEIKNAPTVDAIVNTIEVRPQGKWVFKKFDDDTGISNIYWCSNCGRPQAQICDYFCACCGADMRGGNK